MSEEEELSRVYTINLSKVWLSPENRRTKRAINMIKEFATRHMKAEEIKIDEELNRQMWKRGIRHPPRRVRVKMVKDEDDIVTVSAYSEEVKEEVVEEKPEVEVAAPAAATAAAQETVTEVAAEKQEVKVPAVEEVAEVKEKEKSKKEEAPEKIVLSEEDLADLMAEEQGAKEEKKEPEKGRRKK
ncbi:MAG TPA: 50S ribosomal protein L31e [Nitrososphaerales archaeon]|nr:50S ribosomal protein L31e [Nitrososphaerales archaeon]